MKKRDVVTLIVILAIFLIIFAIIMFNGSWRSKEDAKSEYEEFSLLTDESSFLSVVKNINKICDLANNDVFGLNFIMKDEITANEYKNMSFTADTIYVVSKANLYKFYVKGTFQVEIMDEIPEYVKDGYFILNYDMGSSSYNIEIIDKERFLNASSEEYIFESIESNDYNTFDYTSLNQKSRALMYFNDFVKKMYYEGENAYDLLSVDTKEEYFNTYADFQDFIVNYGNGSMVEFSSKDNKVGIIDNYGNEYVFEISYILNYTVTIIKK